MNLLILANNLFIRSNRTFMELKLLISQLLRRLLVF